MCSFTWSSTTAICAVTDNPQHAKRIESVIDLITDQSDFEGNIRKRRCIRGLESTELD